MKMRPIAIKTTAAAFFNIIGPDIFSLNTLGKIKAITVLKINKNAY